MSKYKQYQNNPDYEFVPYTKEQHKYAMGGNVPNGMGNAQLELEENTLNPDGSTTQFNLPPHSQQSSNEGTQLDPGTLVFSDRLKMGKKTYAQLNKANNTSKEDAILASKANGVSKLTAELMKKAKNKNSLALFEAQEKHKYDKVSKYAKRVGLDPIEFAYGGVKKYAFGDQVPPDYTPSQLPNGVMGAGYQPNAYNDAMRAAGYVPMPKPSNSNSQPLDLSTNMLTQGMGPSINPTATPNTPQSQYAGIVPPNVNNGSYNFPINEGGGSGVDWGNVATQAGLGIAQNAGKYL